MGMVVVMANLFKRNTLLSNNYVRYCFLLTIAVLFLGMFFAFRAFGKTYHSITFSFKSFENLKVDEIAQIKISKSNGNYQTITGGKISIKSDETVRFRIFLKEGYEAALEQNGVPCLGANFGSNEITPGKFLSEENCFEWDMGVITESKQVQIEGVQIKKLSAAKPKVITSSGEEVEFDDLGNIWKSSFDYNTKYKFEFSNHNQDSEYEIKEIKAETVFGQIREPMSCEITELENGNREITIFDPNTEFGGIHDNIQNIEILIEDVYNTENIQTALDDGTASISYSIKFEGLNSKGEKVNLTEEIIDIKSENQDGSTVNVTFNEDGTAAFPSIGNNSVTVKVKALGVYSKSDFNLWQDDGEIPKEDTDSEGYSKYTINLTNNMNIQIKNLDINNCTATFSIGEGIPKEAVKIFAFEGDSAPESPYNGDQLASGVSEVIYSEDLKSFFYEAPEVTSVRFYVKPMGMYSDSDIIIKEGENQIAPTLTEEFKVYDVRLDSSRDFTITDLEINSYTLTLKADHLPSEELLKNCVTVQKLSNEGTYEEIGLDDQGVLAFKFEHGSEVKLKITLKYGFSWLDPVSIKYNDTEIVSRDNDGSGGISFTIPSISSDGIINISEIVYKIFNIKFVDENGASIPEKNLVIKNSGGFGINNGTTARYKENFEFTIEAGDGYSISNLKAVVGSYEFGKNAEGKFLYGEITKDIVIKLIGIERIHFEVKINDASTGNVVTSALKFFYEPYSGDTQEGDSRELSWENSSNGSVLVPYGSDFKFLIKVESDYYDLKGIQNAVGDFIEVNDVDCTLEVSNVGEGEKFATITLKNIKGKIDEGSNDTTIPFIISFKKLNSTLVSVQLKITQEDLESQLKSGIGLYLSEATDNKIELESGKAVENGGQGSVLPAKDTYLIVTIPNGIDDGEMKYVSKKDSVNDPNFSISEISPETISVIKDGLPYSGKLRIFKINLSSISDSNASYEIEINGFKKIACTLNFENPDNATVGYSYTYTDNGTDSFEPLGDRSQIDNIDYNKDVYLKIQAPSQTPFTVPENNISIETNPGNGERGEKVAFVLKKSSPESCVVLINSIKSNLTVSLKFNFVPVFVKFPDTEGVEFYRLSYHEVSERISGSVSIAQGESFEFAVKASKGYDLSSCELKGNDGKKDIIETTSNAYAGKDVRVFKLEDLQEDVEVKASISKANCTITITKIADLPGKNGDSETTTKVKYYRNDQEVTEENFPVEYGGSEEFYVVLEDKCSNSSLKMNAYKKQNDGTLVFKEELTKVGNVYKLIDVRDDLTIKAENLSWNLYTLNFSKNDFANFVSAENKNNIIDGTQTVVHGDSYKFKVNPRQGYVLGTKAIINAVSDSGKAKSLSTDADGNYVLPDVREGYTISVENIGNVSYSVYFAPVEGVTYYNDQGAAIAGKININYGENFEFNVGIEDAYSDSLSSMYISLNDNRSGLKVQKLASGRYIIQNVTEDVKVKACNVVKNKYVVNLKKDEGIEYYTVSNKLCTGENEVNHGENFYFRVKLYPAYADSKIRVMLGNQELSANSENTYMVENVRESKIVTVVGIEKSDVTLVMDTISQLPGTASDSSDIERIIEATRKYNSLDDYKKSKVQNYYVLENLQQSLAEYHHVYNGITVDGLDWYVKVIANPLISDMDACTRIYGKLSSEYILDLYDVYLWDVVNDQRYTLPEGKSVVVHLPTPDISYFENPTGIHENEDGKLDYLTLNMSGGTTSLETFSFSPLGIVANRSVQPGRSSLIDAADANISALTDYTLNSLSGNPTDSNNNLLTTSNNRENSEDQSQETSGESSNDGTENEKFVDHSQTSLGSALKLVLIVMIIGIIGAVVFVFMSNRKNKEHKK